MFYQILLLAALAVIGMIFMRRLRITLKDIALQKQAEKEQALESKSRLAVEEHFAQELKRTVDTKRSKIAEHAKTVREMLRSGETHMAKGELIDAERDFIRVLAFEPEHADALHKLGMIYLQQENMVKAEEMFRSLVKVKKTAVYLSNLALSLFHQDKYDEAAMYYEKANKMDPKRAPRYVNLALVYNKLGDSQKAIKNFERASRLEPRNTEYLFMRAHLFEDLNKKKEAAEIYQEILNYEPYSEEAKRGVERTGENL